MKKTTDATRKKSTPAKNAAAPVKKPAAPVKKPVAPAKKTVAPAKKPAAPEPKAAAAATQVAAPRPPKPRPRPETPATPAQARSGVTVFVKAPPGFDDVVEAELRAAFASPWIPRKAMPVLELEEGGVLVHGLTANDVHEILFRTRTAEDVEWILHDARCHDMASFLRGFDAVAMTRLFPADSALRPSVDSRGSHLFHESDLKASLSKHLSAKGWSLAAKESQTPVDAHESAHTPADAPDGTVEIRARLKNNRLRVGVSLASRALGRRGYKAARSAHAPLREEQAAACISVLGTPFANPVTSASSASSEAAAPTTPHTLVWVPFAGTGTLGFESVLAHAGFNLAPLAAAPLAARAFTFWSEKTWAHLVKKQAAIASGSSSLHLHFLEKSAASLDNLRANTERFVALAHEAGLPPDAFSAEVEAGDFFTSIPFPSDGSDGEAPPVHLVVPLNPPFGVRLERQNDLYARIGTRLRTIAEKHASRIASFTGFILCATEEDWRAFQRAVSSDAGRGKTPITRQFTQGGLVLRLCTFSLGGAPSKTRAPAGSKPTRR